MTAPMNPNRDWAILLGAFVTGFSVLEVRAVKLRNAGIQPSPTLTTTMRRWLGISPALPRRHVLGSAFVAFMVWLIGHIRLGWKP